MLIMNMNGVCITLLLGPRIRKRVSRRFWRRENLTGRHSKCRQSLMKFVDEDHDAKMMDRRRKGNCSAHGYHWHANVTSFVRLAHPVLTRDNIGRLLSIVRNLILRRMYRVTFRWSVLVSFLNVKLSVRLAFSCLRL